MHPDAIESGARTVASVDVHLAEMRARVRPMIDAMAASRRGYFTPTEDEQVFQLLISYRNARNALLELVQSFRQDTTLPDELRPAAFLVAFAAALQLIDAARFLREAFQDSPVVRAKLNDPEPLLGIPAGTYDTVQASLTNPRNVWHLYHALKYYEDNRATLAAVAQQQNELGQIYSIIQRLVIRLQVGIGDYALARLRHRIRQTFTLIHREAVHRALYGLQRLAGNLVSGVYTVPRHCPQLPQAIIVALREVLQPGDVLITRKEYALTNYFLPGFWPHAALYLGTVDQLRSLRVLSSDEQQPRWRRLLETDAQDPARVIEALKDGVRLRSFDSPCGNDAIAVLRPQLSADHIAMALGRSLQHEGKLYDFDFDFTRSDRLVCSEVVYRSYDGVGGMQFPLVRRAGRLTLAPEDLLAMALRSSCFTPVAAFVPGRSAALETGNSAELLLRQTCRAVQGVAPA